MSFSTSLSALSRYAAEHDANRAGAALDGDIPGAMPYGAKVKPSRFDAWIEGHLSAVDNDTAGGENGRFGVVYAGADYVFSSSLLAGFLVQRDWLSLTSDAAPSETSGNGWMAGPYATLKLSDQLYFQGRAAWGMSENDVSPYLTYRDTFDSERWLVTGKLVGHWQFENLVVRPTVGVSYIEDNSEAYVDSLGTAIPGVETSLGQMTFGPEFIYRMLTPGGLIEPRLGIQGIWNFSAGHEASGVALTEDFNEDFRAKIEAGLRFTTFEGVTLDVGGTIDGLGSAEHEEIGGKAAIRFPLN